MARRDTRRIARGVLSEPHIDGRRSSVRQIHGLVEGRVAALEAVADRFDLDVASVYHALAYYHEHPRELRDAEYERENAVAEFRESVDRPEGVEPGVS